MKNIKAGFGRPDMWFVVVHGFVRGFGAGSAPNIYLHNTSLASVGHVSKEKKKKSYRIVFQ